MHPAKGPFRKSWFTWIARLQPWYLLTKYHNRFARAVFAFINSCISIGIITIAAIYTQQPLIFPSLGPSAFLFFYKPSHAASSPRNAILGHGFGILVGWLAFMLFDNLEINPVLEQVGAVALSLGAISALMIAGDFPHPPAASTTLIVSMGMMTHWMELVALMLAVMLLTVQAFVINRFSGIAYPVWRVKPGHEQDDMVATALETETPLAQGDLYANLADQLASRVEAKDLIKKK